ncbi:MAG TPA: tripartite tricarboxylate transporter TctB family protein [Burkholderiales bacterium]|nr:tripartite tricarboxylate transporter TctB family protein [Burkholderiales bacterium]
MPSKASLVLGLAIMACSGWAVYAAIGWPWKAALFPIAIGIPVFCLATVEVVWSLLGRSSDSAMDYRMSSDLPAPVAARRTAVAMAWLVGFFAVIALAGFSIAVPLFVFAFLVLQGRESWGFSLVFSAAVWGFFYGVFDRLLHLPFPAGWIQGWLGFA